MNRNSRMRRLASHLSVIKILLNPPSPPDSEPDSPEIAISPNCNKPAGFLTVPRIDPQQDDFPLRQCSPPPRRCSNSSAYSEQSTISSISNQLSPAVYETRSNSFASEDNEFLSVLRSQSTQPVVMKNSAGNVSPTILLSPVLSRPVRSQSAHSPPFLRNSMVASDSDHEPVPTIESPTTSSRATTICNESTPTIVPVGPRFCGGSSTQSLQRHGSSASDSGSMYGFFYKRQSFRAHGRDSTNSGSSLTAPGIHLDHHSLHRMVVQPRNNSLQRSQSEAQPESQNSIPAARMRSRRSIGTRRPSACIRDLPIHSNMPRVRQNLGHSDPQLYTCSPRRTISSGRTAPFHLSPASAIRFRKNSIFYSGHNRAHRLSAVHGIGGIADSSSSEPTSGVHSAPSIAVRRRRRPLVALNSGGGEGSALHHGHLAKLRSGAAADNRRWSLASLPSSSGYGTPGSISALSSEYSSQEQLADVLGDLRFNNRYDSNDSYHSVDDHHLLQHRPRSRSLSSPVRFGTDHFVDTSMNAMSQLYKERFPKAKQQMENRLQQFLAQNAPLSGFTSAISFDRPPSPQQQSEAETSRLPTRNRPASPCRPTSPIPRPISPLATDSATAIEPGRVVFRSSNQLGCTSSYGNSSSSIMGSSLLQWDSTSRRSTMANETASPAMYRVLTEGATRFIHHQICEIAADCLQKSRDDQLTSGYFCEMSIRLEESLADARQKTSVESLKFLAQSAKQLLMIVARTARLLESLEFDPDEFYRLLEETEGAIRTQLGAGEARVPDLPQYIIDKLGLNKNLITDQQPEMTPTAPEDPEAELRSLTANAPKEEDYENIRLISNGAYGAVYLVRHKKTRQRFALKKMKKTTLLLRNQVFAERDILTFTDNPFVVCFYGSFETKQYLCMVMEYVEGGDCASLLKSAGVLPIEVARLYIAETVLAIEYLHSCGIVHRDLKPDNLLITAIGHIKLTDFGLSKIGLMNRTILVSEGYLNETQQFKDNQLCGTPEYVSPEVILRQGYGKPVDWWALGIILYEFLIGIVPFMGQTPDELFTNIINEEVEYPTGDEALEANAELLIQMLLEKNPVDRLGTLGGAAEVAAHPFFASLDFRSLLRQKAEFVPQLENDEDTSYFDSRADRYNHDVESGDEEATDPAVAPMFWSFSTASPRHSITAQEIPMAQLAALKAAACSPTPQLDDSMGSCSSGASTTKAVEPEPHETPSRDDPTSPSAILLRQRFSAQRQANYSTSSSGTTGLTACSSTDSSMDASYLLMADGALPSRRQTTNFSPLPRFAISSCDQPAPTTPPFNSQPRRATLSAEPEVLAKSQSANSSPNAAKRTESLRVFIPDQKDQKSSGSQTSIFYHAQPSPDFQSRSSLSSIDANSPAAPISPQAPTQQINPTTTMGKPLVIRKGSKGFGFTIRSVRVYVSEQSEYYSIEHIIAAVRQNSPADEAGLHENVHTNRTDPLNCSDLLTHVQTQPVHNMTHPQLMHRLLTSGNEILLHVVPLQSTTIREGDARRQVGKLLRRKPRKPQKYRVPMDRKPRKTSTLFRRLSGKRGTGEIVPGASSQKQSFMPRSASSQDGVASLSLSPAPPMSQLLNEPQNLNVSTSGQSTSMKQLSEDRTASTSSFSTAKNDQPTTLSTNQSAPAIISSVTTQNRLGHRRASGHQILMPNAEKMLPGVDEETIESSIRPAAPPRRKPTIEVTVDPKPHPSTSESSIPRPVTLERRQPPQLPPPPNRPTDLNPRAQKLELTGEVKRPPVPTRKLSPSRLVQRLFRSSTASASTSSAPPTNQPNQKS
ncbi:Non-specific serine/threonine protein kinase [Aphelenchoides besseyi]|nr:Non-specific serine/threonine protein kinase [Aphelenchoides besseyi]